jgi:hypothetical protein
MLSFFLQLYRYRSKLLARQKLADIDILICLLRLVRAQQSAALAVDIPISQLRRGMVMTSPKGDVPTPCLFFQVPVLTFEARITCSMFVYRDAVSAVLVPGTGTVQVHGAQVYFSQKKSSFVQDRTR